MKTILIIMENYEIIQKGLADTIKDSKDIKSIVKIVCNRDKISEELRKNIYDLVILSLNLETTNSLELLKTIKHRYPKTPVLSISLCNDVQYGIQALKSGADGYIDKEISANDLIRAIIRLIQGKKYINDTIADSLVVEIDNKKNISPSEILSNREFEVLRYLAKGFSNNDIAKKFDISPKTVSTYKLRIQTKLKIGNSVGLIKYAIKHNIAN